MKAKPAKAKAASSKAAKSPAKKPAAPKAAPKAAAKPAVKKAADAKSKAAPKPVLKPAPKPAPKAASKPAPKAAVEAPKPKPKPKHVPKPASVATRRKEFQKFRDLLLVKRQDLMRAYTISKGDSKSDLDNGTEDYVDYAVNSYAREFLLSLTELDRKQLLLVEEALNRIDRGEYGRCQQCGEVIPPKRLEVQPWARHCVRCQELEEQGLLPQLSFAGDEEQAEEPEGALPIDEELEADVEVEDEALDEEPLVVDGEDSEE
jgi:DnaK suppressor protein